MKWFTVDYPHQKDTKHATAQLRELVCPDIVSYYHKLQADMYRGRVERFIDRYLTDPKVNNREQRTNQLTEPLPEVLVTTPFLTA